MNTISEQLEELMSAQEESRLYIGDLCECIAMLRNIFEEFPVHNFDSEQDSLFNSIDMGLKRAEKLTHLALELQGNAEED